MSAKKNTEVLIGGKKYTISGYEEEEYLQRVASYINSKLKEFNEIDSFRKLPQDMKSILTEVNIADDYFKAIDSPSCKCFLSGSIVSNVVVMNFPCKRG